MSQCGFQSMLAWCHMFFRVHHGACFAPTNGSPISDEGGANLEYIRDGMRCNIRFLDADVKRLVASMIAIVA